MSWSSFHIRVFVAVVIMHAMALAAIFLLFSYDRLIGKKSPVSTHPAPANSCLTAKQPLVPHTNATSASPQSGKVMTAPPQKEKKPPNPQKAVSVEKQKVAKRHTATTKPGSAP